jgi:DNA-binding Lrp family transcriptional regulator
MTLLDEIDKIMLSYLGKNARIMSGEIERNLQDIGYSITERAIRYRIQRLETSNTVLGYSAILSGPVYRTGLIVQSFSSSNIHLLHRV